MRKFFGLKRALAACIAFTLTLCTFGLSVNTDLIKGSAVETTNKYDEQLTALEKQQADLDEQIADAQEKLDKENDNLEAINTKYKALKKKIENIKSQTAEIETQMVELDTQYRETEIKLNKQNEEITKTKDAFMERIRAMYIAGGSESYTNVLLSSADFYDILMRVELVKRVAEHDNEELDKLLEQKRAIEETQTLLDSQNSELQEKAALYSDKQTELVDQQLELQTMKEESGTQIAKLEDSVNDLKVQSQSVAQEYNKVSSLAKTTTTTTTKATTTKKTTTTKGGSDNSGETTTTKKSPTTTAPSDDKPDYTTAPQSQQTTTTTTTAAPDVSDPDASLADIVCNYAKSNIGGAYVWGGASFKAADCSGLVLMCYAKVGISLPHLASSQANYGTTVSYNNMQPGDLIFFGSSSYSSIYHVAIYTGGGNMVHAANSNQGIIFSNVASFSQYNHITVIKRLL